MDWPASSFRFSLSYCCSAVDRATAFGSGLWYRRSVLSHAGLRPGMKVLDVGCGPGLTTQCALSLVGPAGRVTGLDPAMPPQINLAVQTEVIRRASLFVGTAGSLAWLAPMLGVDTLAAYADDKLLGPHFYAARYG